MTRGRIFRQVAVNKNWDRICISPASPAECFQSFSLRFAGASSVPVEFAPSVAEPFSKLEQVCTKVFGCCDLLSEKLTSERARVSPEFKPHGADAQN
jgi:hypothetical protein